MATITVNQYKKCGVYKITNNLNGKCYIGQSVNIKRRLEVYNGIPKKGIPRAINSAIGKYGKDNFTFEIIEECERILLNEREIYWISEYNSIFPNGYNLSSGGLSPTIVSEETRKRQSLAKIGKKRQSLSDEHRKKISDSHIGIKYDKSFGEKISKANKGRTSPTKGRKMSEEQIERMRQARIGKPNFGKRKKVIRDDGVVYDSITIAAKEINADRTTIHKNLRGKLKIVHGYVFKYYKEEAA